jgi:hypothetical protein
MSSTLLGLWFVWWIWIQTVGRLPGGLGTVSIVGFDLVALAFLMIRLRSTRAPQVFQDSAVALRRLGWLALPIAITLGTAFAYALLIHPIDWDGLDYHLPRLLEAVQARSWIRPLDPYYAVQAYPMLVESAYLWWILHFGHYGMLLLGFLPVFLGSEALVRISRFYGIRSRWPVALWCTLPLVVKQIPSLYLDSFVGAFGLLAVAALLEKRSVPFALALGFFCGAKLVALPASLLLALLFWMRTRRFPSATLLACCVTLGGTLIPNWVIFGNPLYPFRIEVLGHTLLPGLMRPGDFAADFAPFISEAYPVRMLRVLFTFEPVPSWDMVRGGFGWIAPLAGAMGLGLLAIRAVRTRTPPPLSELFAGFLLSSAHSMLRYHLWLAGALAVGAGYFLDRAPQWLRKGALLLLLAQASWLIADRMWFLGLREEFQRQFSQRNFAGAVSLLRGRAEELWTWGEPQAAQHPVDQMRIQLRKIRDTEIWLCVHPRPQQIAAFYGADFSNKVHLLPGPCAFSSFEARVSNTSKSDTWAPATAPSIPGP